MGVSPFSCWADSPQTASVLLLRRLSGTGGSRGRERQSTETLRPCHQVAGSPSPPCSRPVRTPGAGGDHAGSVGRPHPRKEARAESAPTSRPSVPHPKRRRQHQTPARQRRGVAAWARELTRRTRVSRDSRPAAGWASTPGTPAASCQPGRQRVGIALLRPRCRSRCSWRRRQGCCSSGRRADRLCGSPEPPASGSGARAARPGPASRAVQPVGRRLRAPPAAAAAAWSRGVGNREAAG